MRILLTGSAGYIGSSLIKRLRGRLSFARPEQVEFVCFDIRENSNNSILDLGRLKRVVRNIDGVIHLAAISRPKWGFENPYHCLMTNTLGTINVLEAVRTSNPKAWILFGSSREVFGNLKKFPGTEQSPRNPLNAYGVSKKTGEDLLKQYTENYGLRGLTIRFCGVYTGAGDILDRVIPKFIGQALGGKPLTIEGSGSFLGDYVYIDDVVAGIEKAIAHVSKSKKGFYDDVTLAAQNPISLKNLANLIVKITGSKSKIIHLPDRTYDQRGYWGSNAKARRVLKWKPAVALKAGIERAVAELKPIFKK